MFTNIDKMFMINRYRNLLGFRMLGGLFFEWPFQAPHSPSGTNGQASLSSFSIMSGGQVLLCEIFGLFHFQHFPTLFFLPL